MVRYNSNLRKTQLTHRVWPLIVLGAVIGSAISEHAAVAIPQLSSLSIAQSQAAPSTSSDRLPRSIARRVRRDLAQRLNVSPQSLNVTRASRETWPDSCLGLAAANERCATATVAGWRVEVSNGQRSWVYRTDQTAQVLRLETRDEASLPPDVSDRLLQTVAREVNVPANTLKIEAVQPKVWDGCMGIFVPGRMCTQIAISGYQVIVTGAEQRWVYHVSADGTRIVQNPTASGSHQGIMVSFMPSEQRPEPIPADVVFRSTESGGFAGIQTETVLLTDGTIYRRTSRLGVPQNTPPTIEKRLSPQQVQRFQQVLLNQRFQNLDGIRYLTEVAVADYPTTTIQAMGGTVAYIDLEEAKLPPALQAVIQAWKQL